MALPKTIDEAGGGLAGLSPSEAARRLDVSASSVRRWIREGDLEAVKVGGRLRIEPEALGDVIKRCGPGEGA